MDFQVGVVEPHILSLTCKTGHEFVLNDKKKRNINYYYFRYSIVNYRIGSVALGFYKSLKLQQSISCSLNSDDC